MEWLDLLGNPEWSGPLPPKRQADEALLYDDDGQQNSEGSLKRMRLIQQDFTVQQPATQHQSHAFPCGHSTASPFDSFTWDAGDIGQPMGDWTALTDFTGPEGWTMSTSMNAPEGSSTFDIASAMPYYQQDGLVPTPWPSDFNQAGMDWLAHSEAAQQMITSQDLTSLNGFPPIADNGLSDYDSHLETQSASGPAGVAEAYPPGGQAVDSYVEVHGQLNVIESHMSGIESGLVVADCIGSTSTTDAEESPVTDEDGAAEQATAATTPSFPLKISGSDRDGLVDTVCDTCLGLVSVWLWLQPCVRITGIAVG